MAACTRLSHSARRLALPMLIAPRARRGAGGRSSPGCANGDGAMLGLFVPGGMVAPVIRGLKLADRRRPKPTVELDIASSKPLDAVHLSLFVETGSRAIGRTLSELAAKDCGDDGLPCDAVVMMIVRGASVIAPRGGTRIEAGDHVHLFCSPRSEGAVRQAFGA